MNRRAIGIVRVSQRDDDSGHSPEVQVRAMLKFAADKGWDLRPEDILDENVDANGKVRKVSGGAALADRPKMLCAVEAIERGTHGVILAERMDRFFRDIDVQRDVIRRVEAAGGRMETIKQGAISHATAEAELQANLNGSIAQYMKRTAKDRSWDAVEVAIEAGKIPWSQTAPGYVRDANSRLTPDPELRPVVEHAFRIRAAGATIDAVRRYLRDHGVDRSYHGTMHLLRDRVYVGEIHFGTHTPNLAAHEPIIDRELFNTVQRIAVPRGRKPKSDRLLARLGLLRCGSCGSRMVVGTSNRSGYYIYRCPPTGDCTRRVTISAEIVETMVTESVKELIAGIQGKATAETGFSEAESALVQAQAALDSATRVFASSGLLDEPTAVEQLTQLRAARDSARERYEHAAADLGTLSEIVDVDRWDELTLDERRALISAVLERVTVSPSGRGAERITIEPKRSTA